MDLFEILKCSAAIRRENPTGEDARRSILGGSEEQESASNQVFDFRWVAT
jgi:hypothetical protein